MDKKSLICFSAAAAALPLYYLAPGHASKRQKAPFMGRNFAHRGLHTEDGSIPENSLEAFYRAAKLGYGVELDVQLTKDGQVVVFHDDTLDRVCGVSAKVGDKSYNELKQLSLCGTDNRIPLLSEVLKVINGRGAIIVELKSGDRNRELCVKTYELLEAYNGDVCVESFNPMIVAWFRFHARDLVRGQLAMPMKDYDTVSKPVAFLSSRCFFNVMARPQFIAYEIGCKPLTVRLSELMGAMRVCWTSHDVKNEKRNDAVIFEYYRPERRFR